MPYIWERHQSRNFDLGGKSIALDREWVATEAPDEVTALNLTLLANPLIYDGLVRATAKADYQGNGCYFVTVNYRNIDPQQALSDSATPGGGGSQQSASAPADNEDLTAGYTFDLTGQVQHITQSHGTYYAAVLDSAGNVDETNEGTCQALSYTLDTGRAIGLSSDRVEGCDIYVPREEWTREVVRSSVTSAYKRTLHNLAGSTNASPFYNYPAHAVLYLGSTGNYGQGRWNLTHKFAAAEHKYNVSIGPFTVPVKRAWDYLWVQYKASSAGGLITQVPSAVYVERVYQDGNFALIEIGE